MPVILFRDMLPQLGTTTLVALGLMIIVRMKALRLALRLSIESQFKIL